MRSDTACDALKRELCLELRYDGYSRIVEVHAVGTAKDGSEIMRVWQVSGGSKSGQSRGWKILRISEALSAKVIDKISEAPRFGYEHGDKAMSFIRCEI
jgi:hypothetical protein